MVLTPEIEYHMGGGGGGIQYPIQEGDPVLG